MKGRFKILIIVFSLLLIIFSGMFIILYYFPYKAEVNSIIVENVSLYDHIAFGNKIYISNVTISFSGISCCDRVQRIESRTEDILNSVIISIFMERNECMLPALYSGHITMQIILTNYGNWTINCNGFVVRLNMGDFI